MAKTRAELHGILKEILGSSNVYFQPPNNLQMKYPCIRYKQTDYYSKLADNVRYFTKKQYVLMVITKDPDSPIPDKLLKLPYTRFDRSYVADNLYHTVITIYF